MYRKIIDLTVSNITALEEGKKVLFIIGFCKERKMMHDNNKNSVYVVIISIMADDYALLNISSGELLV
jgi:hypothetical protein